MGLTCDTCKFFLAQQPGQPRECHRFPPAVQLHIDMILHPESGQPETRVTKYVAYPAPQPDWLACGEYRVGVLEVAAGNRQSLVGHPRPAPRPRDEHHGEHSEP